MACAVGIQPIRTEIAPTEWSGHYMDIEYFCLCYVC